MIKRDFEVRNEMGLHARAAALFVQTTNKFASDIFVEKDNERVNGKSIMGIMALGISKNSHITIIVNGIDEEEAIEELERLIDDKLVNL
ncbi:HPr family phosphocarrier protein [Wukongibacter sp. M2B1]|uniref:HPr family phosphocarrier protein n=1 Tax=Wukongibacter sp. M2B1 TaxID=3088895 RepID=UPI003D7C0CD4